MESIVEEYQRAKCALSEIENKKVLHQREKDETESEWLRLRSRPREEQLTERAQAFFSDEKFPTEIEDLQQKLRGLHEKDPLFDVELKRRKNQVEQLRGRYSRYLWESKFKMRDLDIKERMLNALLQLAKAGADEVQLVEDIRDLDGQPPGEFRPMRPQFVGRLGDPNSFIEMWLRELREYYPDVAAKEGRG